VLLARAGCQISSMPRRARALVAGACYHLINRGNNRATVFHGDEDYAAFVDLLNAAQERVRLSLFAVCVMPNHFHVVASASTSRDISRWMHWLLTTHASRFQMKRDTTGRVWQGRFKAFPIEQDSHLLAVMRYVERNALRGGLVGRAREWRWGSLAWRLGRGGHNLLSTPPVRLPPDWEEYVDAPQTAAEVEAIRVCVNRQRPYGGESWVCETAPTLGLEFSLRPRGRPKKAATAVPRAGQNSW
jgi:putative transposase